MGDASIAQDDIRTRVASYLWDELGRNLFTVRVMSGVYVA
jgi:hypothetical protein